MCKFSFVVPVYNVEHYLKECVDSLLWQSYSDYEIILIDDGSTDKCPDMCDAYRNESDKIRVIHQENRGLSMSRNAGIAAALGDYIIFCDSDDYWCDCDGLMKAARILEQGSTDLLIFRYTKYYEKESRFVPWIPNNAESGTGKRLSDIPGWLVSSSCNKILRRQLLLDNRLYFCEGITSEDIDWSARLYICAERFAVMDDILYVYRQRAHSITHNVSPNGLRHLTNNVARCVGLLPDAPPEKLTPYRRYVAYQLCVLANYSSYFKGTDNLPARQVLSENLKLLNDSPDKKVRMVRAGCKLTGTGGCMFLLRTYRRLIRIFRPLA